MSQSLTLTGLEKAFHNYEIVLLSLEEQLVRPRGRKGVGMA